MNNGPSEKPERQADSEREPGVGAKTETASEARCHSCGAPLASGALDSLCPACLLAGSLLPGGEEPGESATWMTVFPQLKVGDLIAGIPGVETYEALHLTDGARVRLSVATSGHITQAGGVSGWKLQIDALERLNHPNIARIIESGDLGNRFFMITSYPDGRTLQEVIDGAELSSAKLEVLFRQLNDAVASARSVVVNLGCSFSEVVVGPDGKARLIPGLESAPPDSNSGDAADSARVVLEPGMQMGHYRLIDQIGEGGFAEVWLAEQEEPVSRRVALKFLKEGMNTRRVLARFEAERQALAMLDHPNIARVLDAGASDGGRPYFVMEAVDGEAITKWCASQSSSIEDRLRLVRAVCGAIQHAHQRGIIHRDLKPNNILVTQQGNEDGEGTPKVIDFGIAKAVERSLIDQTLFTRDDQVLGTPEYMSPEQASVESGAIDSRSDVYALGVLLYELLTGSTPVAALEERSKGSTPGFDELRRRIREDDPPPPSALAGATRKTGAPGGTLSRELDWVAMKAIAKEPERRYQSAAELGEDLRRVLEHEAVEAGAPTRIYRVRKFVRRHRVAVLSGAAIVVALLVGAALAVAGLLEARKERANAVAAQQLAEEARQLAEEEAATAEILNAFFRDDLLGRANPYATIDEKDITLREAVDRAAETVDARFAGRPEALAAIHQSLANTYRGLSVPERAEEHGRRAVALYKNLHGFEHAKTLGANGLLANILKDSAGLNEALELHRRVLAGKTKVFGPEAASTLRSRRAMARLLFDQGHLEEGERKLREVLAIQKRVLGDDHPDTQSTLRSLCQVLSDTFIPAKREEAVKLMTAQVAALEEAHGKDSSKVMSALHSLAAMLSYDSRLGEAETIQRRILEHRTRVFGEKGHETLSAMNNLAFTLKQAGKTGDAVDLYRRTLPLIEEVLGPEHLLFFTAAHNLGTALAKEGKHEEALVQLQKAWELGCQLKGEDHVETLSTRMNLADSHDALGNADECLKIYQEIVPLARKVLGPSHPQALLQANNLAFFLDEAKRYQEGEKIWREVCEGAAERYGKESLKRADYLSKLGWNLREQKRFKEAEVILKRVEEIRQKLLGADDKLTKIARSDWITTFKQAGGEITPELEKEFWRLWNELK